MRFSLNINTLNRLYSNYEREVFVDVQSTETPRETKEKKSFIICSRFKERKMDGDDHADDDDDE